MRSGSDTRVPTTPRPGAFAARLVAVFALVVAVVAPSAARAELHTLQLTVGDALGSVVPADGRVQFAADAITKGTGDDGLLGPEYGDGILRFSVDPNGFPDQFGRYRLLLELYGRTSSRDGALVKAGDRRCFTFVDLMPVDFNAFNQ